MAVRTLLIVTALTAAAGCKDKPTRKAPPANPAEPTATPTAPGAPAPDLVLPHSAGGPPVKTTKPHTKADYEKLNEMTFPGFGKQERTLGDKAFEVRQVTADHPRMWATITAQHCLDCVPMELEKWKAKTEDLKVLLGPLKELPGVTFEVGQTHLNGAPVIYAYQVGEGSSDGGAGGADRHFTNAMALYYNDGINQIRVVAEYKDDPKPIEEIKKIAPKEHLMMLALSFLDVYTHAWGN